MDNKVENTLKKDAIFDFKNMNKEEVLLQLKIISEINKEKKITISNKSLEIDNRYFQFLRRYYNGDSRNVTIENVDKIVQRAFVIIDETLIKEISNDIEKANHKNYFSEDNSHILQRFLLELTNSTKGLNNLKQTYGNDSATTSRIDLIIQKINIRIDKIHKLLNIKKI
jgi:hypothetical protein